MAVAQAIQPPIPLQVVGVAEAGIKDLADKSLAGVIVEIEGTAVGSSLGVIRRILEHLGQWAPLAAERGPPRGSAANWPRHANLPLTYHPDPDIA